MSRLFVFSPENSYGDYDERWYRATPAQLKKLLDSDHWMTSEGFGLFGVTIGQPNMKTYYISCYGGEVPEEVWEDMEDDVTENADCKNLYECKKCNIIYNCQKCSTCGNELTKI